MSNSLHKCSFFSGFLVYGGIVLVVVGVLIFKFVPTYGNSHLIVYVGICSAMGSITVCASSLKLVYATTKFDSPVSLIPLFKCR